MEIHRKKKREGEGRRRSCYDGEGEKKGEIWFTTLPMFTNANGKRKCRKMRRPADIPIVRRKTAFSAPVSCVLAENPLSAPFLLSCVRNTPFCDMFRCRFSHPFPFFPFLFIFVLLPSVCVFPSSRLFLFLFSFSGEGRFAISSAAGKE